jgi:four helix bundle protein
MNNFRELKVWQKAITLVKKIYLSTKSFPLEEQFGLNNQIRRCAVSIPSNIAEGAGRKSEKEFEHFLYVSLGSCFEFETQLIISRELEYISQDTFSNLEKEIIEIEKMIRGLQKTINNLI